MKFNDMLLEAPQDIENIADHQLNDDVKNKKYYNECRVDKYKTEILKINEDATIYKLKSATFVCLDTSLQRATYFMHYEIGNNGKLGQYVCNHYYGHDQKPIIFMEFLRNFSLKKYYPLQEPSLLTVNKRGMVEHSGKEE